MTYLITMEKTTYRREGRSPGQGGLPEEMLLQHSAVVKNIDSGADHLGWNLHSATYWLCDLGKVTYWLWVSVSSVKQE